jgi:hypothetical protein
VIKIEYVLALLITLIVFQNIVFLKERKDLLNRIMARDYHQYQVGEYHRPPPKSRSTIKFGAEGGD